MKNLINLELKNEINLKLEKIKNNQRYYDVRKNLVITNLRSIGNVYSFWIENPTLRKAFLLENKQPKTLRKLASQGIQNVNNGWYYLNNINQYGNFVKELNSSILKKLNKIVLGDKGQFNDFRKKRVTLNCIGYTPPSPEKVSKKIKESISRVKEIYNNYGALEAAISSHLEFAGVQPFLDGNKRVSRLIQDKILEDNLLPPAVIPAGEGVYYRKLLCKVLPFYGEGNIKGQEDFYNYCASKVNNSLDDILGDLFEEPAKVH